VKESFLRALHTIKGITRLYGLNFLSTKTHFIEGELGELFNNEQKEDDFNKKKMDLVLQLKNEFDSTLETVQEVYGELFDPTKNNLIDDQTIEIKKSHLNKTVQEIDDLIQSHNYSPILTIIKKLSLIEVTNMTRSLAQIVNNTSKSLDKKVELEIKGDEIYLGEKEISLLKEGLIHLLTNCVDHGIDKTGKIFVSIKEEVNNLIINIQDNGRGIDQEKVLTKALSNQLITEEDAEKLNPQEIFNLIFHPGFSTKENVSETSGRGVGMDVVKKNITGLGGQITIESQINKGTTFTITLPIY
jgi:two-component system chemotaxis sensor kinase CheA